MSSSFIIRDVFKEAIHCNTAPLAFDSSHKIELLKAEIDGRAGPANDLAFQLSEKAVFGGIIFQRSFWEAKLKKLLVGEKDRIASVIRHVRCLFEAHWKDRFQLINRLVSWSIGLTA